MASSREKFLVGFLPLSAVSKNLLVEQFVDAIADLFEVWPTIPVQAVQGRQKLHIRKVVEDVVDAPVGSRGQVSPYEFMHEVFALIQQFCEHVPVKSVLDLVEADDCHGSLVQLLPELVYDLQLFLVELIISIEDPDFYCHFDQVFHDFMGFLFVSGVFLCYFVQLIEDFTACVIDEHVSHGFGCHFTQDLFLGLQCKILGAEIIGTWFGIEKRGNVNFIWWTIFAIS